MSKAQKHLSMIGLYWQNHGKKDRPILAHDTTRCSLVTNLFAADRTRVVTSRVFSVTPNISS